MAEINPLRYRGYYYDTETGFYYLQSRYYDPANRRFINADVYTSTDSTDAISCNMFAYCNNNPVIAADQNGEWLNIVIGAVVGAVVSAVTSAIDSYESEGRVDWLGVGVSAVAGAVSGGLSAAGLGALGGAAGALIESGYETFTDYKAARENGKDWSWGAAVVDLAVDVGMGAAFGAAGSGSKADFAKSCSISNAGIRGTATLAKRAVGATTHPKFTIAAKKAVRKMGRYCWNTLKSEVSDAIPSALVEKAAGDIYDATVGMIY